MIKLNLETKNNEEEKVKNYLEENVSEVLVEKIINGVKIIKENKTLISKKDLNNFMKYAANEARKSAVNNCAIIEDEVVFGWAVHYFQEDEIEGILYNEDGSKFEPKNEIKKQVKNENKIEEIKPKKEEKNNYSLFDYITKEEPEKVQTIENKEINKIEILEEKECKKVQYSENKAEINANISDFALNNAVLPQTQEELIEMKNLINEINSFEDYKDELFDDDNYIPKNNTLNYTINTDTGEVIRVKKELTREEKLEQEINRNLDDFEEENCYKINNNFSNNSEENCEIIYKNIEEDFNKLNALLENKLVLAGG